MLTPCPSCTRHVRPSETTCPFCRRAIESAPPRSASRAVGRAALFAAGLTLAGCGSAAVRYGGPPPPPPPEENESGQEQESPPPENGKGR